MPYYKEFYMTNVYCMMIFGFIIEKMSAKLNSHNNNDFYSIYDIGHVHYSFMVDAVPTCTV